MTTETKTAQSGKFGTVLKGLPAIPVLIICLFELLGLILLPGAVVSEQSAAIGLWYQIYVALTGLLSVAIIYTLWKMKKIGIWIYAGSYVIHNIIALIAGNWSIGVVIIPVIGLGLIGLSYKKFR